MNQIDRFVLDSIDAGLKLLPSPMDTPAARVMLYAIGLQESRFIHRRQIVRGKPIGPAKGFWQFERLGGCKGVVSHPASRYWMHKVCEARGVAFNATAIWHRIQTDDVLAAAVARLLLFTDPKRLPAIEDADDAWRLYIRTWRPGKPHRSTWADCHQTALFTFATHHPE